MSILTQDQLAVLALVGSDASYADPNIPFPFPAAAGVPGPDLQSYPDSKRFENEYGFASTLTSSFPKDATATDFDISNKPSPSRKNVDAVDFPGWTRIREINDADGFGFSVFQLTGSNEFVVAMRGTDGSDLKDWRDNLDYSVKTWNKNKSQLFDILFDEKGDLGFKPASGTVHFVGQSLGGGLAQYAAYEFVDRLKNGGTAVDGGIPYEPTKVTLTTFNGFGRWQWMRRFGLGLGRNLNSQGEG